MDRLQIKNIPLVETGGIFVVQLIEQFIPAGVAVVEAAHINERPGARLLFKRILGFLHEGRGGFAELRIGLIVESAHFSRYFSASVLSAQGAAGKVFFQSARVRMVLKSILMNSFVLDTGSALYPMLLFFWEVCFIERLLKV